MASPTWRSTHSSPYLLVGRKRKKEKETPHHEAEQNKIWFFVFAERVDEPIAVVVRQRTHNETDAQ
jgi:hypothetical protein